MSVARVLFLGGLGRSGITLLERIVGELPGVSALGEVAQLWRHGLGRDATCGCAAAFTNCPFWTEVGRIAFSGWANVPAARLEVLRRRIERTRHIPRLTLGAHRALVDEYVEYYRQLYLASAVAADTRILVDSSRHPALAYCLRRGTDLDIRVVHVVRDSRSLAHSWAVPQAPELAQEGAKGRSATRTAIWWNGYNAAFSLLRRLGTPVLRISHETLIREPVATLRSVAEFAGISTTEADLSFLSPGQAVLSTPPHTCAGDPIRFASGPVPLRDAAWRTELPTGARRVVAAFTAPLLGAYGYPLRRGATG